MAQAGAVVDVRQIVDEAPFGGYQMLVVGLSLLVIMLDGYDILVLSFVAPALAKDMGRDVATFGPLFGAGFFALLVGSLIISPFGDLWGRKGVLLVSMAVFCFFTFMPIVDHEYTHLLAWRFLGGLGLAGVVPSAAAIVTEYAPRRYRGMLVNIMYSGFGLGAVLGGFAASKLIPIHGWQAGFWIGSLLPLVLIPIIWALLPESVEYLVATGKRPGQVAKVLARIDRRRSFSGSETFTMPPSPEKTGSIRDLFRAGRATGTLLLWIVLFCALLDSSLIASWINAILNRSGMPADKSVLAPVVQQLGGVIGTILIAVVIDRLGARLISVTFLFAALFIALTGFVTDNVALAMGVVFLGGFFTVGSQFSTQSVATVFYPVKIRSTGIGWALGAGRAGTVVGPLWAGGMLTANWPVQNIFIAVAVPALVGMVAIWMFAGRYGGVTAGRHSAAGH